MEENLKDILIVLGCLILISAFIGVPAAQYFVLIVFIAFLIVFNIFDIYYTHKHKKEEEKAP